MAYQKSYLSIKSAFFFFFFNSCCQLTTVKLLEGMQDKSKKAYLFIHGLCMTILSPSTYCVIICMAGDFI